MSINDSENDLDAKVYSRIEEEMRRTQSKYPAIPLYLDIYLILS